MDNLLHRRLGALVTRAARAASEGAPAPSGLYEWRVSSASPTRSGDTTNIAGLEYREELPLLYNHDWSIPPVGRVFNFRRGADELIADVELDLDDEFAASLDGKIQRGFMRDSSIGFIPRAFSFREGDDVDDYSLGWFDPIHLERAEIYEMSLVTVPDDRNAVRLRALEMVQRPTAIQPPDATAWVRGIIGGMECLNR